MNVSEICVTHRVILKLGISKLTITYQRIAGLLHLVQMAIRLMASTSCPLSPVHLPAKFFELRQSGELPTRFFVHQFAGIHLASIYLASIRSAQQFISPFEFQNKLNFGNSF